MFDTVIIGAGISGCSTAYFLTRGGEKVALIDQEGIAAGGSGAAGAFISPKFSKGGPLKSLMDDAFDFSLKFYNHYFPEHINNVPLLHIARFSDENSKVTVFKKQTHLQTAEVPESVQNMLSEYARSFESVYLLNDGIVNATPVCEALAGDVKFFIEKIKHIVYKEGVWHIGENIRAKKVIITIGAYTKILDEPYLNMRPVWGQRIDIKTTTKLDFTMHHQLSISASNVDGTVALGATHDVHYHPETSKEPYDFEPGRVELVKKALDSLQLENIEVLKDYAGLRSGSNDYLPLVGRVVKAEETLACEPDLLKGIKVKSEQFKYYPDLYMINGVGGYGFVQGPFLAEMLSRHILEGKLLNPQFDPTRFFTRWAKRNGMKKNASTSVKKVVLGCEDGELKR